MPNEEYQRLLRATAGELRERLRRIGCVGAGRARQLPLRRRQHQSIITPSIGLEQPGCIA